MSVSSADRFTPEYSSQYPPNRITGEPQSHSGRCGKQQVPSRIGNRPTIPWLPARNLHASHPYTSSFSRKLTLVPGASFRLLSVHQTSRMSRTSLQLSSLRRSSSIAALPQSALYTSLNMCHRLNLKYFSVHHVYKKDGTTCTAPVRDVTP
jgi:hypothetical protein